MAHSEAKTQMAELVHNLYLAREIQQMADLRKLLMLKLAVVKDQLVRAKPEEFQLLQGEARALEKLYSELTVVSAARRPVDLKVG